MSTQYRCTEEITCENKGPKGPRSHDVCMICQNYYRVAVDGYLERATFNGKDEQWAKVYALVDKLSAMQEHSHVTYHFFHAVHWATAAQYGRKFGTLAKYMRHVFTATQDFEDSLSVHSKWREDCQCKTWCGRQAPQNDCDGACVLVASHILDMRKEGGQEALDTAMELLKTFQAIPAWDKKSVFTACDTIMGLDWFACAGQGQQKQKSVTGMEISLVWRVGNWVEKTEALTKRRAS